MTSCDDNFAIGDLYAEHQQPDEHNAPCQEALETYPYVGEATFEKR